LPGGAWRVFGRTANTYQFVTLYQLPRDLNRHKLEEKTMPSFEIILPSGKSVDITNKVKTSKSENDIKKALKDAFETDFKKPNE
jgi:hypothetical protein|tara:strand:+ start:644 stop:895 length:252 start_codon:yes stop_codon:yes gene_type:complete